LNIVSTDGHRLYKSSGIAIESNECREEKIMMIVDRDDLKLISSMLVESHEVTLYDTKNHLILMSNSFKICAKKIDGRFPEL
jgi:DNA polymerase III sliding clamp (beta) subunit (PCNA family)